MDNINLDAFQRANESSIRWQVESLALQQIVDTIGLENLRKITLTFQGSTLDDLALRVEGPDHLRAEIEEALRNP
jgi:hypothetical protein